MVATHLADLAQSGRKAATIRRKAAAIAYHHRVASHEPPTNSEGVKAVLRGPRRSIGAAAEGKRPATTEVLTVMLALCFNTLAGKKRDHALLALGFAGAFRRGELAALRVEDLTEVPDGLRVLIRRSKTDQPPLASDPSDHIVFEPHETAYLTGGRIETYRHAVCRKVDWIEPLRRVPMQLNNPPARR